MRKVVFFSVLFLIGVFAASCDSSSDTAPDLITTPDAAVHTDAGVDAVSEVDAVWEADALLDVVEPPVHREMCGQTPYDWLSREEVGQVVSFEPARTLGARFPAALLDSLITELGYHGVEPQYDSLNFELRYTTQDRGQLVEATTMVGVPLDQPADEPLPVALWLHGTTGFVDMCAPSADAMGGPAPTALMASLGYFALAPDYLGLIGFGEHSSEGTLHPYLVGEPVAISNLDAVRAAIEAVAAAHPELPPADTERIVIVGGSQGGHAAFFTERLAPYYAPELKFLAVAAAVPPTNLLSLAKLGANVWGPTARTLPAVMEAMRRWYDGPEDLTDVVTNDDPHYLATSVGDILSDWCGFQLGPDGMEELSDMYVQSYLDAASSEDWESIEPFACYLKENSIITHSLPGISQTPFMATYAELDDLVVTADQQDDFVRLCEMGYRIQYMECAGQRHTEGGVAAVAHMLNWLQDRVDGVPLDEENMCTILPAIDCSDI